MYSYIEVSKIQKIYNTFRKYVFYKNKLEDYLDPYKIYLMTRRINNDNYNKLIIAVKKRSKSLFLPMINEFYKLMCLLKASSDTFKFFKTVNLDNLKKLIEEMVNDELKNLNF